MRTPEELRRRLAARWRNQRGNWLLGEGEWPLCLSVEPPTEVRVIADWTGFDAWLTQWRDVSRVGPGVVRYESRTWQRVGEQKIPRTWQFHSPGAVAAELGQSTRWLQARERFDALERWNADTRWKAALSRHFDLLADLEPLEFQRLCRVVEWLRQHPASGLYPRQLPIPGVDSKWVESRRDVVSAWVTALKGVSTQGSFHAATGLRAGPDRLRMRLLDAALRATLGGFSDIEAPVEDFGALTLPVRQVLIVENLVTGLACEDLPGTVVFMQRGYAVDALAKLSWLAQLPIYYWGDIDTHGLAILSRLRAHLPQTRSLMMDEATLLAFQELWGREDKPHTALELPYLTDIEQALYRRLRVGEFKHVRMEQERVAWNWARDRLAIVHSML